jgi:hypothetical protein
VSEEILPPPVAAARPARSTRRCTCLAHAASALVPGNGECRGYSDLALARTLALASSPGHHVNRARTHARGRERAAAGRQRHKEITSSPLHTLASGACRSSCVSIDTGRLPNRERIIGLFRARRPCVVAFRFQVTYCCREKDACGRPAGSPRLV